MEKVTKGLGGQLSLNRIKWQSKFGEVIKGQVTKKHVTQFGIQQELINRVNEQKYPKWVVSVTKKGWFGNVIKQQAPTKYPRADLNVYTRKDGDIVLSSTSSRAHDIGGTRQCQSLFLPSILHPYILCPFLPFTVRWYISL